MNHRIRTFKTKGGKTFCSAEKRDNIFCKWEELHPDVFENYVYECWFGYEKPNLRWKYKFAALRLIVKSMQEQDEEEANQILYTTSQFFWR
jgi:hypothetical protein